MLKIRRTGFVGLKKRTFVLDMTIERNNINTALHLEPCKTGKGMRTTSMIAPDAASCSLVSLVLRKKCNSINAIKSSA